MVGGQLAIILPPFATQVATFQCDPSQLGVASQLTLLLPQPVSLLTTYWPFRNRSATQPLLPNALFSRLQSYTHKTRQPIADPTLWIQGYLTSLQERDSD